VEVKEADLEKEKVIEEE